MTRCGVLALSYGTPSRSDGIEAYYTRIRHGRPPTPEQLADLTRRYDAIGGTSPLNERTADQVAGLARELERRSPGHFVVEGATKYATPTIEEGVDALLAQGVDEVVGLVLAPLSATMSTGQYHDRAIAKIDERVAYRAIWAWWDAPGFTDLLADRVRDALVGLDDDTTLVVCTAHSLPTRVVADGDDYPDQLAAAADRVAATAGVHDHLVCWQSAGRTSDEWLGPDLLEVLSAVDTDVVRAVVVCPVGFVSDHLEVLYDVDVEAAALATERGLALRRTPSLNDDQGFLSILADLVTDASAT